MLTIDKIKEYWISKNTSRANNLYPSQRSVAVYNDSINVYELVTTIIDNYGSVTGTDLTVAQASNSVTIYSSTGDDVTILPATDLIAGVMSTDDKTNLDNLVDIVGASGAATLPNFAGSIISDGATINTALQELELAIQSTDTNLGTTYSPTVVTITSSTGTSTTIQPAGSDGNAGAMTAADKDALDNLVTITGMPANSPNLGTFTGALITDNTTIKVALQDIEDELVATNNDVTNLITLTGVAVDSTSLGTFTGVTIPDNQTIKQALQALETNLELVSGGSGATNLGTTYAASSFTITSDTGTNAIVDAATSLLAGAMTATDKANLEALIALVGTGPLEYDLGTFTGTTIPDDQTIKEALQTLETALEAINPSSGLPSGTTTQTLRHNGTDWVASSVLVNDGNTIAINTTTSVGYDLKTAGPIMTEAGLLISNGTGNAQSTIGAAGIRLINSSVTGETYNIESSDAGNFNIYGGAIFPALTITQAGNVWINDEQGNEFDAYLASSADLGAPSTADALALSYYPSAGAAWIRFYDQNGGYEGAIHAEGGNLEIETSSIFTITAGTEGFNFNGTGNFVLPNQVSNPGSPAEGSIWYNGTTNRFTVQDDAGVEQLAFLSDIANQGSGGDYELVSSATYTVGANSSRTIYFRAYSNNIAITLGPDMDEGVIYYFFTKADAAYTATYSIPSGYTWWMVGNLNEDLTEVHTLTVDSTDRNSYAWAQRRGTRIFIHFQTF